MQDESQPLLWRNPGNLTSHGSSLTCKSPCRARGDSWMNSMGPELSSAAEVCSRCSRCSRLCLHFQRFLGMGSSQHQLPWIPQIALGMAFLRLPKSFPGDREIGAGTQFYGFIRLLQGCLGGTSLRSRVPRAKPSTRDYMDKRTGIIYGWREGKRFKALILLPANPSSALVVPGCVSSGSCSCHRAGGRDLSHQECRGLSLCF